MKLIRLKLRNFKGIESYTFEPNGHSAQIYGTNGTGKTSVADAMSWLLYDKDTQDKSPANFGIKTRDENGQSIHGLEHTVEGVFTLENGKEITLTKIYKEKWVKSRGESEEHLSSHTTDYYWSEEPVSKTEYNNRVDEIMSEEQFKILTIPSYFPEKMDWQERRKLLTRLCGDIDVEDVIDRHPDLDGYMDLLDGRTQSSTENTLRDKRKKLNREIDNIPSRIDENHQHIKEVDGLSEAKEAIAELKESKADYEDTLAEARSGGGVSDLNVKVQEIESQKATCLNEFRKTLDDELADQREKVKELESKVDESEDELRQATRTYQDKLNRLQKSEQVADSIKQNIEKVRKSQPDPKPENNDLDECPMCGQAMPDDHEHDDNQYEEYVKQFNEEKAEDLKDLSSDLEIAQEEVVDAQKELKEAEQAGAKARSKDNQRKDALDKAKAKLQAMKNDQPSIKDDGQYKKLETQKQALLDKIDEIKRDRQSQIDEIQETIDGLDKQIEQHQATVQQAKTNQQYRDRIKDLQDHQKQYAKELEEIEAGLYMIDEFKKAEADYITDKVNDYFEIVSWRLFEPQVNGGVREVCDPMVGGVPYSEGLNTGSRIKAGLDIIQTMSGVLFKKEAPVWVDNAESITQLPDTDLQVISTIVSKADTKLRVETADEKELAVA